MISKFDYIETNTRAKNTLRNILLKMPKKGIECIKKEKHTNKKKEGEKGFKSKKSKRQRFSICIY